MRPRRRANPLTSSFGIASCLAVASGCMVAGSTGVGFNLWARNVCAWIIGGAMAGLIERIQPAHLFRAVLMIAPLTFGISLFNPGQNGVHRWISLGPLTWNVSFLLLPAVIVAFSATTHTGPTWTSWAVMLVQIELVIQPDASQATAFAAALMFTLWTKWSSRQARIAASLFFLFASVAAWDRPDPLAPVPEVEGIIELAGTVSVVLAALCVVSLMAVAISPLLARKFAKIGAHPPAFALSVYFLACMVMPLFGAFPVPLVGMGMSPILGFWLGIGMLGSVCDFKNPIDR